MLSSFAAILPQPTLSQKGRAAMTWLEQDLKDTREQLWRTEFHLFTAMVEGAHPSIIAYLEQVTAIRRAELLGKSRRWNASLAGTSPSLQRLHRSLRPDWWNLAPDSVQRPACWDDSSD